MQLFASPPRRKHTEINDLLSRMPIILTLPPLSPINHNLRPFPSLQSLNIYHKCVGTRSILNSKNFKQIESLETLKFSRYLLGSFFSITPTLKSLGIICHSLVGGQSVQILTISFFFGPP